MTISHTNINKFSKIIQLKTALCKINAAQELKDSVSTQAGEQV